MARVKVRPLVFWTAALLVCAAALSWMLFTEEEGRLEVELDRLGVDIALEDVDLVQGEEGRIKWQLKADLATYEKDQSLARLVEPRFTLFLNQSNQTVHVAASRGEVEQARDRVRLWPRVTAVHDDYRVQSDEVDYLGSEQRAVFSGNVSVQRPGMTIHADSAQLALDTQQITATGKVRVVLSQESFNEQ